jgi:TonB family protein
MMKFPTSAVIAFLAFVPPSNAQSKHYGRVGEFVVTATGMTTTPAHEQGQRYVAVFVRVRYDGSDTAACVSLSAKLTGTDDLEYDEFSRLLSDSRWPNRPPLSRMAHGQESSGAYVFELKSGVDPLELLLTRDSQSTDCDVDLPGGLPGAPHPADIELDVHDLSAPVSAENGPSTGFPNSGGAGYSFPLCIYCPRATYTLEAVNAGVEGTVVLVVVITPDGKATDIQVKKGIGHGLDAKAVETVSTWRFKPASGSDGKPAAVRQVIEVTFSLRR